MLGYSAGWDGAGVSGGIKFSTDLAQCSFCPPALLRPCVNIPGLAPSYKDVSSSQLLLFQRMPCLAGPEQ